MDGEILTDDVGVWQHRAIWKCTWFGDGDWYGDTNGTGFTEGSGRGDGFAYGYYASDKAIAFPVMGMEP